ncbi:hypothetical protein AVEN_58215-1 [Araneus ventricosus]|uniref:Uncharacterized protein n=1 Tax=Araneus ventricosus TaxID=182803 RepID=A0A4Y2UFY5_ARAVE|nr:hypothetical protein AVEN_58215-1 [Araneus ventricosus]
MTAPRNANPSTTPNLSAPCQNRASMRKPKWNWSGMEWKVGPLNFPLPVCISIARFGLPGHKSGEFGTFFWEGGACRVRFKEIIGEGGNRSDWIGVARSGHE